MSVVFRRRILRIASRIGLAFLTFIFVVTLLFLLLRLAPGDPITYKYRTGGATLSAEQYAQLRHEAGLDQPVFRQYISYFGELATGDFGDSFTFSEPVISLIRSRIGSTLLLMLPSMVIGSLFGTWVGALCARRPGGPLDNFVRVASLTGYSIPQFWLGILLLQIFSLRMGLLPSTGMVDPTVESGTVDYFLSLLEHAALPVFALSLFYVALFARYTRVSMIEQSFQNYVLTARAKGLTPKRTFRRHVIRNGLLPVITLAGLAFRYLFGGAVLIETVFSWPGIGLMLFNAVLARDFPLIQGIFVIAVVTVILVNLLVDVIYGFVDPRVRTST